MGKFTLRKTSFLSLAVLLFLISLVMPLVLGWIDPREGFIDFVKFSDYNSIDRIQMDASQNIDDGYDPSAVRHMYCIGGTVTCGNSVTSYSLPLEAQPWYDPVTSKQLNSYTGGKTYVNKCANGSRVKCLGSVFSTMDDDGLTGYKLTNGQAFPMSTKYSGFTADYSINFVPVKLDKDTDMIQFLNTTKQLGSFGKCDFVDENFVSTCRKYSIYKSSDDGKGDDTTGSSGSGDTTSDSTSDEKCGSTPCIADFGTNVGDPLCCGQTGVLQNTKYVCPSNKPTCSNFKCGSKFGTCK
jgi:hypothetical protein